MQDIIDWSTLHVFPDGALFDRKTHMFIRTFIGSNGYLMANAKYGPVYVHRIVANRYCGGRHRHHRVAFVDA